jgi:hypothetical protein
MEKVLLLPEEQSAPSDSYFAARLRSRLSELSLYDKRADRT